MNVIIGAGLAAARAIESMRAAGYDGRIALVGDEPHLPYERPPLSKELLRGELSWGEALLHPQAFYDEQRVDVTLGDAAVALDVAARTLRLAGGASLRYERLLIATGSRPVPLRVEGASLADVLTLRGLDDARRLRERLLAARSVAIVGAGLVGLEVASVARSLGRRVVVIERGPQPLMRVLGGHPLADAVLRLHVDHGVEFRTGVTVEQVLGARHVEGVRLSSGERVEADLVLAAVGVRPASEWLAGTPVAAEDGVLVDEHGETGVPNVYAAGDVARVRLRDGSTTRLESYGHAHAQGVAVGRSMAGVPSPYAPFLAVSSEQFGARVQALGRISGRERAIVRGDLAGRAFMAFLTDAGRVTGAFAMNRPRDVPLARRLIQSGAAVDERELASDPAR